MSATIGKPVRKEDLVKVPRIVALIVCFFSEWGVWLFSLGRKKNCCDVVLRYIPLHRYPRYDDQSSCLPLLYVIIITLNILNRSVQITNS